jgi:predicted NAD-dependent protein-ADP-ribosyltransferase YbiA (DUF1768 family)
MNPNIIQIPNAKDKTYGFLSNDSKHGFTLKDNGGSAGAIYTYWPTVTHYIEAKKFEGTQYEDTIRNARTVTQVRILSREREVRVTTPESSDIVNKQKIYGNKRVMQCPKVITESELEGYLWIALSSKFKYNLSLRNALIATAPRIIEGNSDKISELTAQILMEIRENLTENGGEKV